MRKITVSLHCLLLEGRMDAHAGEKLYSIQEKRSKPYI